MKIYKAKWEIRGEEEFTKEDMGLVEDDPDPSDEEAEAWWRKTGPLSNGSQEMVDWSVES